MLPKIIDHFLPAIASCCGCSFLLFCPVKFRSSFYFTLIFVLLKFRFTGDMDSLSSKDDVPSSSGAYPVATAKYTLLQVCRMLKLDQISKVIDNSVFEIFYTFPILEIIKIVLLFV